MLLVSLFFYFSPMKCKFSHVGHLFVSCGDVFSFSFFLFWGHGGQGGYFLPYECDDFLFTILKSLSLE